MAVAVDGNGGGRAQHLPERAELDARVSGFQVHYVFCTNLRMDRGEISRSFQGDQAEGAGRALGGYWRHVGRTGFEHAGRRIAGEANSGGQALLSEDVWGGCEDRLESGLIRLQLATPANLQEVRHRLLCHPEAALGTRIHHLSLQAVLVGSAGWKPAAHLLSA